MKLAQFVYGWRINQDLTQRQAARALGITHTQLFRLESGLPVNQKSFTAVLRWLLSE